MQPILITRTRHLLARGALVATTLTAALMAAMPAPAGAEVAVVPRGAAMSPSASCSQGDIEIDYSATGAERQVTDFTAEDGRELHHYDVRVYSPDHENVEFVLSQTDTPPPTGSVVAVHVTIGTSPPDAQSAEFLVAYRCDIAPNEAGGKNEVVSVCTGMFGSCPTTAKQVVDGVPVAGLSPPSTLAPPPAAASGGILSRTGAEVIRYLLLAGLLTLVGLAIVAAVRKRRRDQAVANRQL